MKLIPTLCLVLLGIASIVDNHAVAESAVIKSAAMKNAKADDAGYVGASTCGTCHAAEFEQWQASDHFQSMLPATPDHVLGDFDDVTVQFHGEQTRLFTEEGQYLLETGADDDKKTHIVDYTFGHRPLQQYLVELAGGRYQALNLSWDSRPESEGGQRWFHLRDEMSADSPFRWTRHLQNWNGRCAECHSTNVSKGFDTTTLEYNTTFSEVNVACESCHGPGAAHVASARLGGDVTPLLSARQSLVWQFMEGSDIATPIGEMSPDSINMCGGCHSRRAIIDAISPTKAFEEQYRLSLLDSGLYHADGQILDEVFVLGSFLQSKMAAKGVTCQNCHDAHTSELKFDDNRLCAQCHNPVKYDAPTHLLHDRNAPGGQCVDCHMPETVYMQVDARRDHRFGIPNPALTQSHGVPNACNDCHEDKSTDWALAAIPKAISDDGYAGINTRLRQQDVLAVPAAVRYINNPEHATIKRATLLASLPFSETSLRVALRQINTSEIMMRLAAVQLLGGSPAEVRRSVLPGLINDPAISVRQEAGRNLVDLLPQLTGQPLADASGLVAAYRASLAYSLDMPSTQAMLANVQATLGDTAGARESLQRALSIEPHFVPALLNLADMDRAQGKEDEALALLQQAVKVAPDSGAANHSYGLALVRRGDVAGAMPLLDAATRQDDRQPRYAYVLAVGLDSLGQTSDAVKTLQSASAQWPNQYDLLMLEVMYREKAGLLSGIKGPLRTLSRIAPNDPQVNQRLTRYRVFE